MAPISYGTEIQEEGGRDAVICTLTIRIRRSGHCPALERDDELKARPLEALKLSYVSSDRASFEYILVEASCGLSYLRRQFIFGRIG
ncbi:hypothetical protein NECAME_01236 [Necator americanus]|uniref:Uncharacterized protein n=1 Tax=Necator americanus TaxID=51031 RepID=W2TYY2_NECAM|nr:hypothetical protein NECAME_01236 [Necator americanus]ETN87078.1 hypothetical protein NECAME_01236 [Necator americanus]